VSLRRLVVTAAVACAFASGIGASGARPATSGARVTISMLGNALYEPALSLLIANFERVYPDIAVDVSYAASAPLAQLETTELAAGNAPDVLTTNPGCGTPVSVCELAKAGDLVPMIRAPWAKRSLPLVTSLTKYGRTLYAFEPSVSPTGVFTNDDLFAKLGLKVPQTFSQLLSVCRRAKASGTAALIFDGASGVGVSVLVTDLAVATLYGKDKHWNAELKAGKVSFDGSPGWHHALQNVIAINEAECFQPGVAGTTLAGEEAQFAQGQGLMAFGPSASKGVIDSGNPQFTYSFYPFPGGTDQDQTRTPLMPGSSLSVNAHSSAQNRAAAQTFIDFIARPSQNALAAQITGSLTQYEALEQHLPAFMSPFIPVFKTHAYVMNPPQSWWNADVLLVLQQDGIGLITGQESIDDLLSAMDDAWKEGPS
jgi:raffinose/stachyose/melibiose transport system substrate-binding protein